MRCPNCGGSMMVKRSPEDELLVTCRNVKCRGTIQIRPEDFKKQLLKTDGIKRGTDTPSETGKE